MEPKYNASSECGAYSMPTPLLLLFLTVSRVMWPAAQRVDELEDALKKKDEDMKQMEERYKKYLEKAKSVSKLSHAAVT